MRALKQAGDGAAVKALLPRERLYALPEAISAHLRLT